MGSLHIKAALSVEPERYGDLEERIPISTRTLSDLLEESVRIDAFQLDRVLDEDGDGKVYRLDRAGERVLNVMERHGAVEAALLVQENQATVDEVQELLLSRLEEE